MYAAGCTLNGGWALQHTAVLEAFSTPTPSSPFSLSHAHPQCPSVFMFLYHSLSRQHTLLPLSSVLNYSLTLSSPLHCLHNTTLSCSHAHYEQKIHTHIALHTPPNVATRTVHLCRPKINQLVNKPSRKTSCTCSVMNQLPIAHGLVGADLPECFN